MDSFYASVEVLDHPELSGLPVAVGGPSGQRGVIAAASYEARVYGVRSAMPTGQALRLCPDLVLRPGRMGRYQELSREVMQILRSIAPAVEPLSLDEAFLDLTGCERLHLGGGDWEHFARDLQRRILEETGLWASVGMGETRRIAKISSGHRKPRGCHVVPRGEGARFLQSLPVSRLWGVGPKLTAKLESLGLATGRDIATTPRPVLQSMLGKTGLALHDVVHAREGGRVHSDRPMKTVSHETTFGRNRVGYAALQPVLLHLCEKVASRMRHRRVQGRVVQLKIRNGDFHTLTRRSTLPRPVDSETEIYTVARRLLHVLSWESMPVRLIGVGVQQLVPAGVVQGDLFASEQERSQPRLDQVLDRIQDRFGAASLGRATTMLRDPGSPSLSPAGPWQDELYLPLDVHGLADPTSGASPAHPALPGRSSRTDGRPTPVHVDPIDAEPTLAREEGGVSR